MRAVLSDKYMWDKEFQHLPADFLHIPGLHLFGHTKFAQAGEGLDEHYHPGCMEITVLVRGNQKYEVGGQEYSLSGGDVFTTFQDEGHSTEENPIGIIETYWFQIDLRVKEGFFGLTHPYDDWMFGKAISWNRRITKVTQSDITLLRTSFENFYRAGLGEPGAWIRGYSLFLAFFSGMIESVSNTQPATADVQAAIEYIRKQLPAPISLEEISEHCGHSVSHMKKKFRDQIGMALREYINLQRIELGKEWLKNTDMTVTEIAYRLNFGSSSYFSTAFRQHTGCTPSEYRELLQKNIRI